jgi:HK97 family phage major capsid protein
MDAKLKELQEQKNAKAVAIKELAGRQENWTAEDRSAWDVVNKEYDDTAAALKAREDELKSSEAVQKRLKEIEDQQKALNGDKGGGFDGDRRREMNPEQIKRTQEAEVDFAMRCILGGVDIDDQAKRQKFAEVRNRLGIKTCQGDNGAQRGFEFPAAYRYGQPAWASQGRNTSREFRVGLDVATSGAGMETIPEGFMYELERRRLFFASPRQVCRVIKTASGNELLWPTVDDTSNSGVKLAEATTIGTSVDPTFAAVTFNAIKYSSKPVFISQELIEDSAFNLASEIASLLGERLGRIEASATTTGDGSGDPNGVVTASGTGVTSATATVITADEIIGLVHSLDPAYRNSPSTGFMFHDTVLLYIRKFKTADGQYLWQPGFTTGEPDRLLGYPYTINQAMEALSSGLPVTAKKHMLFADFSKFVIRDVANMRFYRLDERYRDTDQTAFIAFTRLDSDAIQANAIKALLQA